MSNSETQIQDGDFCQCTKYQAIELFTIESSMNFRSYVNTKTSGGGLFYVQYTETAGEFDLYLAEKDDSQNVRSLVYEDFRQMFKNKVELYRHEKATNG